MKADIAVAGLVGLAGGGVVFLAAYWYKDNIPLLIPGRLGAGIVFFVLLVLALSEMPVMLWALRKMVRDQSTPRLAVLGTHVAYSSFAAIYAAAFVLLTGEEMLALVLAAIGVLRFVSGVWIR